MTIIKWLIVIYNRIPFLSGKLSRLWKRQLEALSLAFCHLNRHVYNYCKYVLQRTRWGSKPGFRTDWTQLAALASYVFQMLSYIFLMVTTLDRQKSICV
ncbi:hypothetical protein KXD40_001772 [Peronospora effusa]|nr:hypothetical protein KXD40_001772 [Peronospora effusa]